MKVAFFGTSDRSLPILKALQENFELLLCVTKDDTLVGKKQEVRQTAVKTWAIDNNIDLITTASIKNTQAEVISKLEDLGIELAVVADFSFMIPQEIIDTPKYKIINIHFSLLPKYRGASPVQHAIMNLDTKTGITYYLLDKGMDTGDILSQITYDLDQTETSEYLYERFFDLAAQKLPNIINAYTTNKIQSQKQDENAATYCWSKNKPKTTYILKGDALINWNDEVSKIEAQIRAFNPWPIAFTTLKGLQNNSKIDFLSKGGTLRNSKYSNYRLKVYSSFLNGSKLTPLLVQLEGKSIQKWEEFLNGYFN